MKQVDLSTMKGGEIIDMFNEELKKVLANIADENVKPDESRKITIELSIKPDKTRRTAQTKIDVHSKLASVKPSEGLLFFDENENGEMAAYEDDYKQQEFDGISEESEHAGIYKMPKSAIAGEN
jgi:hypothetical protein